jgi:hypothetical protein
MLLFEFFENSNYPDHDDDNSVMHLSDLRKTRLTLAQLNRLRAIQDIKLLEREKKIQSVRKQYKTPAQAPGL